MTTIGVLECDHVADRHQGIAGDYTDMFAALFVRARARPGARRRDRGRTARLARDCAGWLCTGLAPLGVRRARLDRAAGGLRARLRDAGVLFAGVCFGHQILARARRRGGQGAVRVGRRRSA